MEDRNIHKLYVVPMIVILLTGLNACGSGTSRSGSAGPPPIDVSSVNPKIYPQQIIDPKPIGGGGGGGPSGRIPSCAVDDVYKKTAADGEGSVSAPGVLGNDTCTKVASSTSGTVIKGGKLEKLTVNENGSFSYTADASGTSFKFTYTTETGDTATVTVNHNM